MPGTEDGEAFTDEEVSKQVGLPLSPDGAVACVHQRREDTGPWKEECCWRDCELHVQL